MLNFKIYSFGQFRAVSGSFGQFRAVSGPQNLGFVPGISGMPETLPETSMPETLPTLPIVQLYWPLGAYVCSVGRVCDYLINVTRQNLRPGPAQCIKYIFHFLLVVYIHI